jgi:hypothetical protein
MLGELHPVPVAQAMERVPIPLSNVKAIFRQTFSPDEVHTPKTVSIFSNLIAFRNVALPRYTPSTTFETFPFPEGLTPDIPAQDYATDPRAIAIAAAAARLNDLRENWLNPPDLVIRVPEVVAGYPDRILPKDDKAAAILKTRTLTNLYNQRPAWLVHAHAALDQAVAEAYGWGEDWAKGMSEDEVLARLFRLNQARAAGQA